MLVVVNIVIFMFLISLVSWVMCLVWVLVMVGILEVGVFIRCGLVVMGCDVIV